MKDKGLLSKPSAVYQNHLPALPEDKVTVSYEVRIKLLFKIFTFSDTLVLDEDVIAGL